jgi:hypothetical protein
VFDTPEGTGDIRSFTAPGASVQPPDDQDHRQELGAGDQEQSRGVEERQDQEQHRVHRIAGTDHHGGRHQQDRGENVKQDFRDHR